MILLKIEILDDMAVSQRRQSKLYDPIVAFSVVQENENK